MVNSGYRLIPDFQISIAFLTIYQLKKLRAVNKQLRISDQKLNLVLNHLCDLIYQMDLKTGKYEYMSPAVEDMLGYSVEEVIDGGVMFFLELVHPDDTDRLNKQVQSFNSDNVEEKLKLDHEFRVRSKNGGYVWVENQRSLIKDEKSNPVSIVGNVRDISKKKVYMEELDRSLKEKKVLLSEIHHRIKNNLSIVSSLIELQRINLPPEKQGPYTQIQSRIKSIALIHEKLYQTDTLSDVELSEYITDLSKIIADTYNANGCEVEFKTELDDIQIKISQAVSIGLICNEMISNCFKHAFKGMDEGEIIINLEKLEENVKFSVKDNGIGLPVDFDINQQDSLGMTLLNAFSQQINGELLVESNDYTVFSIEFEPEK